MNHVCKISFLIANLWVSVAWADVSDNEQVMTFLDEIDFFELQHIEVSLDNVFNIFDGLILDQTVSIATGQKQDASIAPAVTSVITAQDIEAMGARTVTEALRSVPGLHMSFNPLGYVPSFMTRGIFTPTNPEMLVMINNVPIKALNTGGVGRGWGPMPVANIARIEVIRGPGSAVYGADAFSGVINILTKSAANIDETEIGLRVGSYDTYEAWALYGKQYGQFDIATSFELTKSNGFDALIESDGQTFYDRRFNTHASNAPSHTNNQKQNYDFNINAGYKGWRFHGLLQQRHLGQGVGGSLPAATQPKQIFNEDRLLLNLTKHWQLDKAWEIKTQLSYYQRRFDSGNFLVYPAGAFNNTYSNDMLFRWNIKQASSRGEVSAFYHGFQGHDIRLGIGYQYEDLQHFGWASNFGLDPQGKPIPPNSPMQDLTDTDAAALNSNARKNLFVYLQDSWQLLPDWRLTAGVRYDDYSDFGSTINPRFALVHQFSNKLTGKLLYGSAFRSPSLEEFYIKNNGTIRGNPNIEPEKIDTIELALVYQVNDHLNFHANIFNYRAKDKIVRLPDIDDGLQVERYQNAGMLKGNGLEMEMRWKISPKTSLLANYAYVDTEDRNGESATRVPHQSIYLRADRLLIDHWFLDLQMNWVGLRKRIAIDTRAPTDDYTTIDLTLRYKGLDKQPWDFALGVRNLLNDDIREPTNYRPGATQYIEHDLPIAEREWFAEIRYRF